MVKIGVFIDAIQVAVGQGAIQPNVAAQAIQAFVDVGEFFLRRNPFDHAATADEQLFAFEKRIQETGFATDVVVLGLLRGIADAAIASDATSLGLNKARQDSVATVDARVKLIGKGLSDVEQATDVMNRSISKPRSDAASATDAKAISLSRSRSDSASASDVDALHLGKARSSQATTADSSARVFGKRVIDAVAITDDINGNAVADDDQTIQFIKSLTDPVTAQDILQRIASFSRAFAESLAASDVARIQASKQRSDLVATSDSGLLFWQSYADPTLFAEDYVGNSQPF